MGLFGGDAAEYLAHQSDELQCARIAHTVKNPVGILAGQQHFLVAKNRQMLGNITLRGADGIDNILDAGFLGTDHAQDLEPQGMRDRLQGPGSGFDVLLLGDEVDGGCFHEISGF